MSGREEVFAAGDVARFPESALGELVRVEHEDHANTHGRVVGANAAGAAEPGDHLPFFYSDLFDFGYEAVGAVDARASTRIHWTEPRKKGVVAYVDDAGRPRGLLLWGSSAGSTTRAGSSGPALRSTRTRLARSQADDRDQASSALRTASSRSRSVTLPAECVDQRSVTRLKRMSMSGWWFSVCASVATRWTNAIASPNPAKENSCVSAESISLQPSGTLTTTSMPQGGGKLRRSRKRRQGTELLCEWVFRPLAHLVVLVLASLRVPPPAVVLAATATGLLAAYELAHGHLVLAAILLQVKTVLDNADGQLARLTGRESVLGRYLDSESDLLVDAALFAALGSLTGEHGLALAAFAVLTLVLGINFNVERLYRREHGETSDPMPPAWGIARVLERVYGVVYAPQDRLVEAFIEHRLVRGRAGTAGRLAYHDRWTVAVIANFGLSTQLAALGLCLALGRPAVYLWLVLGCGLAVVALAGRRERLLRRAVGALEPRNENS